MQPLLEVEGLKKTYPGFQLNGVSFSIYEDCITGFIVQTALEKLLAYAPFFA